MTDYIRHTRTRKVRAWEYSKTHIKYEDLIEDLPRDYKHAPEFENFLGDATDMKYFPSMDAYYMTEEAYRRYQMVAGPNYKALVMATLINSAEEK